MHEFFRRLFIRTHAVSQKIPKRFRSKRTAYIAGGTVLVFAMANICVYALYRNKTYPNTSVNGQSVSGVSYADLASKIDSMPLLPTEITLQFQQKITKTQPSELGVSIDGPATERQIKSARSWLPLWNLISDKNVPFTTAVDDTKLQSYVANYIKNHKKTATNAQISLKDGVFSIEVEKPGHSLDADLTKALILQSIARGQTSVYLQAETIDAKVAKKDLQPKLATLNKQQATPVTVRFKDRSKVFTPAEIAVMFDVEESHVELADANIQAAVTRTGASFGILVKNTQQAVAAIKQAITETRPLVFELVEAPKPTVHYTYCVAARGVSTSYLGGFSSKVANVLADARGWGLKKQVTFSKTASSCDFTVWLSAASQMPTFGAICDSSWSCRVGPNVVINFDRWQGATTSWNQAGGTLDNYRNMVINHEVGHWFGYYHAYCGGAGQLAPVMQQQSIDLQGCKFNPWPTSAELAAHRRSLGL